MSYKRAMTIIIHSKSMHGLVIRNIPIREDIGLDAPTRIVGNAPFTGCELVVNPLFEWSMDEYRRKRTWLGCTNAMWDSALRNAVREKIESIGLRR